MDGDVDVEELVEMSGGMVLSLDLGEKVDKIED